MKLIMDFKADWHNTLKEIMSKEWGMDTTGLTTDVPVHYFTQHKDAYPPNLGRYLYRIPSSAPQNTKLAGI